jgi:outer membrane protein assembly factor BamD
MFLIPITAMLFSCSSIEKIEGQDKAETYYLRGMAYLEDNMYDQALEKFKLVKNKFPYSKYAIEAELKIADTYYQKEDYLEAARTYSAFAELHPDYAKRDYSVYRSALSFYNLMPETEDRDLSISDKALVKFKELLEYFPNSEYFKDSMEKYTDVRKRLAEREMYIANFYFKKDHYTSALNRFLKVTGTYQGLGYEAEALYKIAYCYKELDEKDKINDIIDRVETEFPDSKFAKKARELKEKLN